MQEIEILRSELDQIHHDMALLFKRRLNAAEAIWKIKKQTQTPVIDLEREKKIIHQFDALAETENLKKAYQAFFKSILNETKIYLKNQHNEIN